MSLRQKHALLSALDVVGSLLKGQRGTGPVSQSLRARHVLATRGEAGSRQRATQSKAALAASASTLGGPLPSQAHERSAANP